MQAFGRNQMMCRPIRRDSPGRKPLTRPALLDNKKAALVFDITLFRDDQ